ncbi:P-loop containing nucleoside triphosphate hydrolase protein [Phanerochaete sordida]|uniref:DNA 3'-5' helicase n=1 Tax=Phanerochaete sordida TaxID=48140 RepID=A0A9P3GTA8_9APHY|nr:P-loop containing nucleoside triphosphate hydrolase protein [Phanerochaete sordida]
MKIGDGFKKLLKKEAFTSRIVSVAFDEAHCINQWESFHSEYWEISRLRYQLTNVPFILASATFTPTILSNIKSIFGIFSDAHGEIWGLCATDSFGKGVDLPDIQLVIQWCPENYSMCSLWQCLVRAKHFGNMRTAREARKEHDAARKRKKAAGPTGGDGNPVKQRRTKHSEVAVPKDEPDVESSSEAEDTFDAKSEASELDETEPIEAEDQDDNDEGVEQQDLPAPTVELDVGGVGTSERGVERMNKGAERQALLESRQMAYVEQGKV